MSKWVEYTGNDEQIAEIRNPANLVIFEYIGGMGADNAIYNYRGCDRALIDNRLSTGAIKAYLICQPNPLADMICQQARTGKPVWCRYTLGLGIMQVYETTEPDWNIEGAEYSFKPLEV